MNRRNQAWLAVLLACIAIGVAAGVYQLFRHKGEGGTEDSITQQTPVVMWHEKRAESARVEVEEAPANPPASSAMGIKEGGVGQGRADSDVAPHATIEGRLKECLEGNHGIDNAVLFHLGQHSREEVLRLLIKWLKETEAVDKRSTYLHAICNLAKMGFVDVCPESVMSLCKSGPESLLSSALECAANIPDPSVVALYLELMAKPAITDEDRLFKSRVLHFARHTGSPSIAAELNRFALDGSLKAVESLVVIGDGADSGVFESLLNSSRNPVVKVWASRGRRVSRILESPNVSEELVKVVTMQPSVEADFNWQRWALSKIVSKKLGQTLPSLRAYLTTGPEKEGYYTVEQWKRMRLRLISAIYRLGGPLSDGESRELGATPLVD